MTARWWHRGGGDQGRGALHGGWGGAGPALRERFPRAIAERLQALAWWDWPHEKLKEALPDFRHLKVAAFLEKYGA